MEVHGHYLTEDGHTQSVLNQMYLTLLQKFSLFLLLGISDKTYILLLTMQNECILLLFEDLKGGTFRD